MSFYGNTSVPTKQTFKKMIDGLQYSMVLFAQILLRMIIEMEEIKKKQCSMKMLPREQEFRILRQKVAKIPFFFFISFLFSFPKVVLSEV